MNIDEMTFGELKQIAAMFNGVADESKSVASDLVGKYVIVRSRNEGINAGIVKMADETGVILTEARRLWYHKPKDKSVSWYEGVAQTGLDHSSKISCPVDEKAIIEDYSMTLCSKGAEDSIREAKTNEQG